MIIMNIHGQDYIIILLNEVWKDETKQIIPRNIHELDYNIFLTFYEDLN